MGEVFLARDMRLGRRVALKFLRIVDEQQRSRFDVEARATARLTHENIVAIYDVADHDGVPYMVLEYVPGKTLAAWLRERMEDGDEAGRAAVPGAEGTPRARVPESRAAEMLLPVVRALECAHAAGIVHRDLKPANIMLTDSGTVKVLDFGVAKLINVASGDSGAPGQRGALEAERPAKVDVTAGGAVVGTLAFMAPEQWSMEGVDGRADLWAIGILLFQLVAGEHPLAPISNVALASVPILDEPMPSVRARRTSVGSVR
jgi:serine/threonine protein kinase